MRVYCKHGVHEWRDRIVWHDIGYDELVRVVECKHCAKTRRVYDGGT